MCTTTKLGLHPQAGFDFPLPANCPVNGFGGSWYHQPFGPVPIYNRGAEGVVSEITWAAIDDWATRIVSNVWVTTGTCFGLCVATLAFVIALTPNKKKGKPFHTSLLLALIFEISRLLSDMGRASNVGLSPYSAYLGLTNDFAAITFSPAFQGLNVAGTICATLAFFFTVICLYIQASGLLTGLHIKRRLVYVAVISYLLFASFVAFALRITITIYQSLYIMDKIEFKDGVYTKLLFATGIAYAVCLGSYCTVSLASVCWLMYTRSQLIVSNRPYDTALTILSLVLMESFVVPIVFLVLQAFPGVMFTLAELVVLPSVLVLLPMGSLFMTAHTSEPTPTTAVTNPISRNNPSRVIPELESYPLGTYSHSSSAVESYNLQNPDTSSRAPLVSDPVDRELRSIDGMGSDDNEPALGRSDPDLTMKYRARGTGKTLEARKTEIA